MTVIYFKVLAAYHQWVTTVHLLCLVCFQDLEDDPYDSSEADPMKCQAIESSLWELKVIFFQCLSHMV